MILQILIISSLQGGVILLDSNGESCDGDQSDGETGEPVECSNNFVFVGAEIKTGKSSIRSKQSKKKVMLDLVKTECIIVVIGLLACCRVEGVVASHSCWRRCSCTALYCQHKAVVDLRTNPVNVNSPNSLYANQSGEGREMGDEM